MRDLQIHFNFHLILTFGPDCVLCHVTRNYRSRLDPLSIQYVQAGTLSKFSKKGQLSHLIIAAVLWGLESWNPVGRLVSAFALLPVIPTYIPDIMLVYSLVTHQNVCMCAHMTCAYLQHADSQQTHHSGTYVRTPCIDGTTLC